MFGLSMTEMLFLGALALIVIGPKQLPELARNLGRFMNELKRSTEGFTNDIKNQARIDFDLDSKGKADSNNHGPIDQPTSYPPHEEMHENPHANEQLSFDTDNKYNEDSFASTQYVQDHQSENISAQEDALESRDENKKSEKPS